MKLSDYVIDYLASRGITHVFEVAGGSITHLLDSLYERDDIRSVCMHHEQAAAFAAEGYARASGKIGVAMATSGPGATNLITGIGSCYFDSIPTLFITGQVNTYEFKFDKPVRQIGFQETDIVNIIKPIVKEATLLTDEKAVRYHLERAINVALNGRPGPVLLDMPMNVQRAEITPDELLSFKGECAPYHEPGERVIDEVISLLNASSRPVILAGGGVRLSGATDELYGLACAANIPVVSTLMGLDAFPHDHGLYAGMIGTYGNRYANLALANSDLVIAVGTRLDTRQTGTKPTTFARGATIIHVEIDLSELSNKIKAHYPIVSDAKKFLTAVNTRLGDINNDTSPWLKVVRQYKKRYPDYVEPTDSHILPNYFMNKLSGVLPEDAIICVDIGQNQMWSAQSLIIKKGQRFLTEGGMASMGSALPMAIGASFACPDRTIVAIAGDGGFQMNIQELQTVRHHNLPIKMIMVNNHCYGMVRQFQEQYFNSRFQSTVVGYSSPDFQKVVSAYDIPALKVEDVRGLADALHTLFSDKTPMFLEVTVDLKNVVTPKLGVNKPIEEQDPALSSEELKSNMIVSPLSDLEKA